MPVPKRRFYLLLSLAFVPALMAFWFPLMTHFVRFTLLVVFVLAVVDFFLIPKRRKFLLERSPLGKLSIGADNPVEFLFENRDKRSWHVEIRDHAPKMFMTKDDEIVFKVNGLSHCQLRYHVKPVHKGHFTFQRSDIRILGPLGLVQRQYTIRKDAVCEVYPNLIEMNKFIRLYSLSRLDQAGYKQKQTGIGTEFSHLRDYRPGDDYRKIDWKATGRKGIPVTRVHRKEDSRNIIAVLDAGRMMTTQYGILTKLDLAVDATLILAAAAERRKDNFGLLVYADTLLRFLPPAGANTMALSKTIASLHDLEPSFNTTDHGILTRVFGERIRKNSMIFLFSELADRTSSAGLEKALAGLDRHRIHLVDFEEKEQADAGKSYASIIRQAIQDEEYVDRETRLRGLGKQGVKSIRVNETNIRQEIVNSYLSA